MTPGTTLVEVTAAFTVVGDDVVGAPVVGVDVVGASEGDLVGEFVTVGESVGRLVGVVVGADVVGDSVGKDVGLNVGERVGAGVGLPSHTRSEVFVALTLINSTLSHTVVTWQILFEVGVGGIFSYWSA